jgi:hypothetical protein
MPYVVIATVAVVLAVAALLFDGGDAARAPASPRPDSVATIARRVEALRGLRFSHRPRPLRVSGAQARREALASLDEDYPPARRRADAQVLALLGLIPPGTDLGDAVASTYGDAVAGYYDPRSGRLRIVAGAQTASRVLYEITLAHELTHALEDQRFGLDAARVASADDRALAYTALVEGTATATMFRYAQARFGPEELLGGLLASAFQDTGDLPPFLSAQLVFPYTAGRQLVDRLLDAGGGRWAVVDAALRFRPPASTEQVMHPDAYLRVDEPDRVSVRRPAAALGAGWRRLRGGTIGEWETARLLARAGGNGAAAAAAGWGGDAYALLGRGARRALVVRWRWDTPRDEREFATALRAWGADGLPGSIAAGRDAWRTRDGAAAIAARGGAVTLALAPDLALARRAARSG